MINKIVNKYYQYLQKINSLTWEKKWHGKNRLDLKNLKNSFANRRCFIMGNGPSLLKCDLSLLKNEVTIGSNANYLIWDKMGFIPNFLTVEDNLVAEDRAKELSLIKDTTKIFPQDLLYCLKPDENTIFINFLRQHNSIPCFSSDFENVVYWGGTVSYLNIQLAYYLGCNPIYLIGFDHSYKVPDSSKIKDFVIKSENDDENHIHPDYFGKGYRWHDPMLDRMENSYKVARKFLEFNGVNIFNATVEGKLEVFERIDYNNIFQ